VEGMNNIISIIKGPSEGSQFMGTWQEYFIYFQSTIDSLSQYQKFALIHILSSLSIMFCLFTLVGVYAGNQLIDYFKLTVRFPRFAKYIELRQKFTRYYFIWNTFMIFSMLLVIIVLNVYAFTLDL
jgi:hypothetical protein